MVFSIGCDDLAAFWVDNKIRVLDDLFDFSCAMAHHVLDGIWVLKGKLVGGYANDLCIVILVESEDCLVWDAVYYRLCVRDWGCRPELGAWVLAQRVEGEIVNDFEKGGDEDLERISLGTGPWLNLVEENVYQ